MSGLGRNWESWQRDVVRLLRSDFVEVLHAITPDDIDWSSWRPLYEHGRSPRQAIERALERDL
jgi:hypothetical protein